jgi:hypothetical protein
MKLVDRGWEQVASDDSEARRGLRGGAMKNDGAGVTWPELPFTMPTSQRICACTSHGCAEKHTVNERGVLLQGKMVGAQEYRDHYMCDKRLKYMASPPTPAAASSTANRSTECSNIEAPDSGGDRDTPGAGDGTGNCDGTDDSAGNYAMAWTSEADELADALEESLSDFQFGFLQDISVNNLVFCKPSAADDLSLPPPLQSHATVNAEFLQYQEWIMKLYVETEKLDCEMFERCRNIKSRFLDDLRKEWARLNDLKCSAWRMASTKLTAIMPHRPDPGSAQVIDTCEYHSNLSQNLRR